MILLQSLIWKCQKLVDYQIRVADKFPKILIMECDFLIYILNLRIMFNKDFEWKEMFDNAIYLRFKYWR